MPQLSFPEGDDRQFQCWMKDGELDCMFADRCGLEVGRHAHDDHGLPNEDIKWGKIWNKVGIVSKDYGTVIREQWGRTGEQWGGKVKYAYGKTKTGKTSIQGRNVEESSQQWIPTAVKYKRGVFKAAPPADSDDSWPYKLCEVWKKQNRWVQVKKTTVEGWKRLAVMSQADIDAAAE